MNYYVITYVIYDKSEIIMFDTSIHKTLRSSYIFILNEILKIIKKSDEKIKKLYLSKNIKVSDDMFSIEISRWDDILKDLIEDDLYFYYCDNFKYTISKHNGLLEIINLNDDYLSNNNNIKIPIIEKSAEPPLKKNKT